MGSQERRRTPRKGHDSVLEIYDRQGRLLSAVVRLVDLSASGAAFASTATLALGESFKARLRLLDKGVLDIAGRVVRVQKKANFTLYGIEFDSVTRA